ncbi:MAG: hypothetical protein C0490_20355, partial [Marivirga sp.]|nr:hypothetical protein [Marivirga sp.]
MDELNVEMLFVINDGNEELKYLADSSINLIAADDDLPDELTTRINAFYFKERLGRSAVLNYPGWWRSFTFASHIARKYKFDKAVHIESDFYITGKKILEYVRNLQKGWVSLFSECYNFPETAIQIICGEQLVKFAQVERVLTTLKYDVGDRAAEDILPFTEVNRDFLGDRFGELHVLKHWSKSRRSFEEFDYFGQLPSGIRLLSSNQLKQLILNLAAIDQDKEENCLRVVEEF